MSSFENLGYQISLTLEKSPFPVFRHEIYAYIFNGNKFNVLKATTIESFQRNGLKKNQTYLHK